jgi:hypothetical protein
MFSHKTLCSIIFSPMPTTFLTYLIVFNLMILIIFDYKSTNYGGPHYADLSWHLLLPPSGQNFEYECYDVTVIFHKLLIS